VHCKGELQYSRSIGIAPPYSARIIAMRQYALSAARASCGTAENRNSANFAFWAFSEVHMHDPG
jgi:hypothetical protein